MGTAAEALRRVAAGAVEADELPGAVAAALRLAPESDSLVLDNLHEITSPQVHAGLVRLVERPPPNLSLLVTTRRDPPWPLPRLRLAGLVAEVRAADLAFRVDEAAQLFMQLGVGVNGVAARAAGGADGGLACRTAPRRRAPQGRGRAGGGRQRLLRRGPQRGAATC